MHLALISPHPVRLALIYLEGAKSGQWPVWLRLCAGPLCEETAHVVKCVSMKIVCPHDFAFTAFHCLSLPFTVLCVAGRMGTRCGAGHFAPFIDLPLPKRLEPASSEHLAPTPVHPAPTT